MRQRLPKPTSGKVRQAMAHATDRRVILGKVYFGNGEVASDPISRALGWAYNPGVPRDEWNVAEAGHLSGVAFRSEFQGLHSVYARPADLPSKHPRTPLDHRGRTPHASYRGPL